MLIVTAVGPVNGQRHFRFVLEQKVSYAVGRDKAANMRFDSRYLRPKEGTLEVGDWNPSDHTTPPKLMWRPEPKKSGAYNALKLLSREDGEPGSIDKDDYRVEEQTGGGEVELVPGKGVELGAEAWFSVQWCPLHFSYDRMKDESDELKATLRKYCLSWTESFDVNDPPEVVIAAALKSSHDNNLAVCYGIPIVVPAWLSMLSLRLRACWKTVADSQDSFEVPSTSDPDYEPPLDESTKKINVRSDPELWKPKKANRTLFKGWKAIVMKNPKRAIVDKKYFLAMGSGYDEVNVIQPPLKSPQELIDRIQPAMQKAEEEGLTPFVVWHAPLKKDFEAQGSTVKDMVVGPCGSQKWFCTSGLIIWGAVKTGGVREWFEHVVENTGGDEVATVATALAPVTKSAPPPAEALAAPAEPEPEPAPKAGPSTGRLPRRAASRSTSRAPSHPPESTRPDVVPSTYPDDTASMAPPTAKPLKRRAGRVKIDLDDDLDMAPSQPASQVPASYAQETQLFTQVSSGSEPSASLRSRVPDSMDVDTPAASLMPSSSTATRGGRLKRRAGGATQSTFLEGFDTTVNYQDALRKKEEEEDIRKLYEQTKRGSSTLEQGPAKRPRMEQVAEEGEASAVNTASIAELMDIDEENDFVAKALKSARDIKKEAAPPAKKARVSPERVSPQRAPPRPVREPASEEEEELEEAPPAKGRDKQTAAAVKKRATQAPTQVDKDERFLQAIRTAVKKKQAVDELDKEFNNLRILKPGAKAKSNAGAAKMLPQDHPDWAVVNDFDDQLRGNFIEVVRKDLLRKDGGARVAAVEDHGKVNFKKFKKKNIVRREPLQLQLAAQTAHSAEMGEPYWPTEQPMTQVKRGGTQARTQSRQATLATQLAEEDDMPLVPTSRRRLLTQIREDDDDDVPTLAPSTRRRGTTPNTQSPVLSAPTSRRTRAGSALSDVSSAAPSEVAEPKTGRGSSTRASTRAPPTQRARRGTQAAPVVLYSDDDDTPFATARTRAGGRSTARGSGTGARSTTLNDEGMSLSRGTLPATATRRRLLADDDGDDVAFKGVQKKRRLG